ncbi:biotin carboxylase [Flexithrix dorotheae]|uniref:biotin carboxylase n=1 Tax=Flexithrix dorotheae TaxID=70993 RepID=UPI00035C2F13|nr:biotin carboxylase [Flexithrix dorotheae]
MKKGTMAAKEPHQKPAKPKEVNKEDVSSKLQSVSDIRRFFYKNEEPIYFVSATNFNLLGADEWIKDFRFINYIDCYDQQHPNVFAPKEELPHEEFQSIEDITAYLLEHKEVHDFVKSRGKGGKVLYLMFDERVEKLAKRLNLKVCFPSSKLRAHLDNKIVTNRVAEKAGVPCVPYVLEKVDSFQTLQKVSAHLGKDLVVQTAFGDSGHTTFFISNEGDYNKYKKEIEEEPECKIMKKISCRGSAIEACVTRHGTIVAPLLTELVGFKELTPYKGGWCGNEIYPNAFTKSIRDQARKYTEMFGNQLRAEGYMGYFELDFLIEEKTNKVYLGELNPRITGASSITNHAVFALADCPLYLFHILEWMDVDYHLNIKQINQRWAKPENIDNWGQMVIKHTEDTIDIITEAPQSGIYSMDKEGNIKFSRFDTHRRAVENENEAFFLRILKPGDYQYEGADMGILVSRGRFMTDDFKLNARGKKWINGIKSLFKAEAPSKALVDNYEVKGASGFKML